MIMTTTEQRAYDCVMSSHVARTVAKRVATDFEIDLDMAAQHVWSWSNEQVQEAYQEIMSEHALVQFRIMNTPMSREKSS